MTSITFIIIILILFLLEICYFRIASKFNIIDKPNHRSSHTTLTLRGGGIIFSLSMIVYILFYGLNYEYFLFGLLLISTVSFIDDLKPVSNKIRISVHLCSVALMFYQVDLFAYPMAFILLGLFFVIGSINAINFMDGINGITGLYSLVTLCSFLYINTIKVEFIDNDLLLTAIFSVLVFLWFNFRKKAKCFAGDVGSVGIAFLILFLLIKLLIITEDFSYIMLLLLYGLDTASTIGFRIYRQERIQDAHRSHFYQFLANEKKFSHLTVAIIYGLVQLIFNYFIISWAPQGPFVLLALVFASASIFIVIRFSVEGSSKLLNH